MSHIKFNQRKIRKFQGCIPISSCDCLNYPTKQFQIADIASHDESSFTFVRVTIKQAHIFLSWIAMELSGGTIRIFACHVSGILFTFESSAANNRMLFTATNGISWRGKLMEVSTS